MWRRTLRFSLIAMMRSSWRTFFSVSGMAIGIIAVMLVFALGAGAERAMQEVLEQMGRNLLVVNAGRTESDAMRGNSQSVETLTMADWRAILEELPYIEGAAPVTTSSHAIRYDGRTLNSTVSGTTPDYFSPKNYQVIAGRQLTAGDVKNSSRVAVVGAYVGRELFLGEWPLGETLMVDRLPFTIVGILKEKGVTADGANEDNQVIIPVSTAQRRLLNVDFLNRIYVQTTTRKAFKGTEQKVRELLRRRHALEDVESLKDDFDIQDQESLLRAQAETGESFSWMVWVLAGLALGLAGVGLLAVSLMSVRERYSEIGLRLAVGARRGDILFQFLVEAAVMALGGGCLGLGVGGAGILFAERFSGWPMALTWGTALYPFTISLGVALVFGAYPAMQASRLDPIVALRRQ